MPLHHQLFLLLLLLLLLPLLAHAQPPGLTLSPCATTAACAPPRVCAASPATLTCPPSAACRCLPPAGFTLCNATGACPPGERCFSAPPIARPVCLDPAAGAARGTRVGGADDDEDGGAAGGLTLDPCLTNTECRSGRTCLRLVGERVGPCAGAAGCVCLTPSPVVCTLKGGECEEGEVCAVRPPTGTICVSAAVAAAKDLPPPPTTGKPTAAAPSDPPPSDGKGKGEGVTLDPCTTPADCARGRNCRRLIAARVGPCSPGTGCVCLTEVPILCDNDTVCDEGEVCAPHPPIGTICVSAAVASSSSDPKPTPSSDPKPTSSSDPKPTSSDPQPTEPPPSSSSSQSSPSSPTSAVAAQEGAREGLGLALEHCTTTPDCRPPRVCLDISAIPNRECAAREGLQCKCGFQRLLECATDGQCSPGERCAEYVDDAKICIAESVLEEKREEAEAAASPAAEEDDDLAPASKPDPTPAPEDDPACIAVSHLAHLPPARLLYPAPRLARVLCDAAGSCATPGHMVRHAGEPLMMARYCARVGCEQRVESVNSPRYARALVVESATHALVFTAFAGRWGTRAEEAVLGGVIRAGF